MAGKTWEERRTAMRAFEETAQFLISTEAGGEGLNLQRRCHVMVNFDLPWNPMRLVQRVGRLYRYGQQRTVVVFNLQSPRSLDDDILAIMYARLYIVAHTMVPVGEEFRREQLEDDILGQLCEVLEIEDILETALHHDVQRTQQRIDEALERAKQAAAWQRDLFKHATRYDPSLDSDDLRLTPAHLNAFVEGMFRALEYRFESQDHAHSWMLHLPVDTARRLELKAKLRVTTNREIKAKRSDAHLLDAQSPLFKHLMEAARHTDFGGLVASIGGMPGGAMVNALVRWQNERGILLRQEHAALSVSTTGTVQLNPPEFKRWLLEPISAPAPAGMNSQALLAAARLALETRLGSLSQGELYPAGYWIFSAAWCEGSVEEIL